MNVHDPRPRVQGFALLAAALAGMWGAAGVILAAVGAHLSASPLLATASTFLLLHAAASVAAAALVLATPGRPGLLLAAPALFLFGSLLFCGDLSLRALTDARLFPMAAPIGGTALILGWLVLAASAFVALRRLRR